MDHTQREQVLRERIELSKSTDKTLFIKEVINNNSKNILITAPRKFSKTTNLEHLKRFLEIPTDKQTKLAIQDRETSDNYKYFQRHNFRIYQDQQFFQNNFGTYPVFFIIGFKSFFGHNWLKLVDEVRSHLKNLFRQYSYLLKSSKLNAEEINQYKKYHKDKLFRMLTKTEIVEGLHFLSRCLSKHFDGRKVFLIIDDYDQPLNSILMKACMIKTINFCFFFSLYSQMISNALQSEYVGRAVLSGVHYFDIFRPDVDASLGKFPFLGNHPFTQFYALTESELHDFFRDFEADSTIKAKHENYYDGYVGLGGVKLYPIYSTVCVFRDMEIFSHLSFSNNTIQVYIPIVRYAIEKLCLDQTLVIQPLRTINQQHFTQLRLILRVSRPCIGQLTFQLETCELYLSFLLNHGCLTYEEVRDGNVCSVKLVNDSIKAVLQLKLFGYYKKVYAINDREDGECLDEYLRECAEIFDKISPDCEDCVFRNFVSKFNEALNKLNFRNIVNRYHNFMFDVLCKTGFILFNNQLSFTNGKPDLVFHKQSFTIVIKVTLYRQSPERALREIVGKYRSQLNDEIIYLSFNVHRENGVCMNVLINSRNFSDSKHF